MYTDVMENTVSEMTLSDLRKFVLDVVDERLLETGDSDQGLEMRDEVRELLLRQSEATKRGERGIPAAQVYKELGLG